MTSYSSSRFSNNNSSNNNNNRDDQSWMGIVGTSLAVTTTALMSYWTYKSVKQYGLDGTLRLIWEGDPYTPTIRKYINLLELVELSRIKEDIKMNDIEEALERARLDSVDDDIIKSNNTNPTNNNKSTTKEIVKLWIANYNNTASTTSSSSNNNNNNLEKALAGLSHNLDNLANKVDSVVISSSQQSNNSKLLEDIKKRKKLLSKQLVLDMERCDAFLTTYQVLTTTTTSGNEEK